MELQTGKRYDMGYLMETLFLGPPPPTMTPHRPPPEPGGLPAKTTTDLDPRPRSENAMNVFVRVRPLLQEEKDNGMGTLDGLAQSSSDPADDSAVAMRNATGDKIAGFKGVFGPDATNEDVFQRTVLPRIGTIMRGGTVTVFCYGYTGSGKTHTVLGYGDQGVQGLHSLAAQHLLGELVAASSLETSLFVSATACEVYGNDVFDLLGSEKLKCTLSTDDKGQLQIRGPAMKRTLKETLPGLPGVPSASEAPAHATIVTRTPGLRIEHLRNAEDLDTISKSSLRLRSVGSSSVHKQSSRSHAVLKLEVVSEELLQARDELEELNSLIPPLLNAMDNVRGKRWSELVDTSSFDKVEKTLLLRSYDDDTEWGRRKVSLEEEMKPLEEAVHNTELKITVAAARLEQKMASNDALGGSLLLVDLAGADKDKREVGAGKATPKEKKESANINKSLLALKECLRAVAGVPTAPTHPPFRQSKLTRILEDALMPETSSSRRNHLSESVMVVNVSPADQFEKATVNTLRYAQLFKAASTGDTRAAAQVAAGPAFSGATAGQKPWAKDQAKATYQAHTPDHSAEGAGPDGLDTSNGWSGQELAALTKGVQQYGRDVTALLQADAKADRLLVKKRIDDVRWRAKQISIK